MLRKRIENAVKTNGELFDRMQLMWIIPWC